MYKPLGMYFIIYYNFKYLYYRVRKHYQYQYTQLSDAVRLDQYLDVCFNFSYTDLTCWKYSLQDCLLVIQIAQVQTPFLALNVYVTRNN